MVRALFEAMADLLLAKVAMDSQDQAMEELQSHLHHMVVAKDFSLLCHM
jgi:hypothetical protein